ncbi:MAG: histidine kinase N-terminal 7TM domain-containing protein [Patescibacteria group bacterium]
MVKFQAIILFIISFLEILLAGYVYFRNRKNLIGKVFSFFTFCVSFWVWPIGIVVFLNNQQSIEFFTKLTWVGPIFMAPALLLFSWIFPYKSIEIKLKHWLILIFPVIVSMFFLYSSTCPIIDSIEMTVWRRVHFGPGIHIFNTLFVFYWIWAMVNFYQTYKASEGIHRWQLKYLLIGIVVSSFFGILFDLIFPWFGVFMYDIFSVIGAITSVIWLGFVSYILFKKNI